MHTTSTTPTPTRKVTSKELADHLKLTPRTLAKMRAAGQVPYIRINSRTIRYDLAAVEGALAK